MLYKIKKLTREHQGRIILNIPELVISAGKITSLIGPNGAGKTTLLHLLAFLDTPSSGEISFGSRPVRFVEKELHPLRQRVVLVDQYPILFTGSVYKNLEFGLKVRKIEKKRRSHLIEEALEMVGMQDFIHAEAHKLSGGETKRVALARALVVKPEVLLCDEPTANVDSENQEIIQSILERANGREKISIIFATHSLSQAQRLADKTVILKDGRPSDLSRENVLPATILGQNEGRIICRLHNDVRITVPVAYYPARTSAVRLFLNPAKIILTRNGEQALSHENLLPGKVVKIVGGNGQIKTTVDTGVPVDIFISLPEYARRPPLIGEGVLLSIPDEAITIE
ncbi:MAG: ATP-binding cassette domain-containing protein [Proteobacteria bacterium]|nr:ATP-binding cassette domain-containing protein [Pseudomonadota bacterium]